MPLQNGLHSIIHAAGDAVVSAFTYTQVYCGVAGSPTINDTVVPMVAGATIDILVRTISGTAGIFVIGDKVNTTDPGGETGVIL